MTDFDTAKRTRLIRFVYIISILVNGGLALAKILAGVFGSSMALLGDGIDSLGDAAFASMGLYTAKLLLQPPDPMHPWGYGRIEAIATKVLGMIMIFAGGQLAITAAWSIWENWQTHHYRAPQIITLYVSGISVPVKLALAGMKYRSGKRINSKMLIADARNMLNDSVLSASVLVGLSLTILSNMPVLERFLSVAIGLWILYGGGTTFFESSRELMDRNENIELYRHVFEAVTTVPTFSKPHRVRIRKINNLYEIILDVLAPPWLRLDEAHILVEQAEHAIRQHIPEIFDIVIHLEPQDIATDHSADEGFGMSPEILDMFEKSKK